MKVKLSRIFAGSIHRRVFKIQDLGYSQGGNMATLETGKTLAGCKPQHTRNIQSWYHFAGEKIQLWCSGAASLNSPLMWQRGSDQPRSLVGKIKTTRSTKQLQNMKEPNPHLNECLCGSQPGHSRWSSINHPGGRRDVGQQDQFQLQSLRG